MDKLFKSIHHVSLIISSLEKSSWFYCEVLGLETDKQRPTLSSEGLWLKINEQQQLHLLLVEDPYKHAERPEHPGRDRHLALKVTDLSKLVMRLNEHKIAYTMSKSGRQALFCRDPDNNVLEIQE